MKRQPAAEGKRRRLALLLALLLLGVQMVALLHHHPPVADGQHKVCLQCLVLEQLSSTLPSSDFAGLGICLWMPQERPAGRSFHLPRPRYRRAARAPPRLS
jgi:hypothetical protein